MENQEAGGELLAQSVEAAQRRVDALVKELLVELHGCHMAEAI